MMETLHGEVRDLRVLESRVAVLFADRPPRSLDEGQSPQRMR
jgi:hypothetical protein